MTDIIEEIKTIIQNEANNNPPPEKATIIKTYPDNHADIQTNDKILSYVEVIGTNQIEQEGIVCYADGLMENSVFITDNITEIDVDRIYELIGLKIDKTEAYSLLTNKADKTDLNLKIDKSEAYSLLNNKSDKNHVHEPLLWNTPEYDSNYINTASQGNLVDLYKIGKLIVCDFYFSFKNIPTTDTIVVNNIPSDYQPVKRFNITVNSIGGKVILLTMLGSNIYLKHYTTGTLNDTITGVIPYICGE